MGRAGSERAVIEQTKDPLGDRMKREYENATRFHLPRRTYTIIRADGRSFHSFTRGLDRPFDYGLMEAIGETTKALCEQIAGTVLGYCQSDEITLLLTDFSAENTEPWFGGNLQKIVSVSAAIATAQFNRVYQHPKHQSALATFDARAFTIDDPVEVANCLLWRQQDAERNAISMIGQAAFPHRELQGVSTRNLREKLFSEKGIDVADFPEKALLGQVCFQETIFKPVTYTHKRTGEEITTDPVERRIWTLDAAPRFAARPGNWLYERLPRRADSEAA